MQFAEILKARLEENTKSVQASLIKNSTPDAPLGNGTTTQTLDDGARYAKQYQNRSNSEKKVTAFSDLI